MGLFYSAGIAVFTPLLGFLMAGLAGFVLGRSPDHVSLVNRFSQIVTCSLMGVAVIASCYVFYTVGWGGQSVSTLTLPWVEVGQFTVSWGIKLDALSTTMMFIVSFISFWVHVYAVGYMAHDPSIPRFMAYLSFFTYAMLALVTAPNLLQLFFGWEGVGFASYLLIGFWYEKPSANSAAFKAFIVNRVGDVGLALGICAIFFVFQTVDYDTLFKGLSAYLQTPADRPVFSYGGIQMDAINFMGILFFVGAMGKSAQFGLHTWLPDAMEGPTPVSALIHAATMVTAGVFLIARLSPLYDLAPVARDIMAIVGAVTALFAAFVAVTQNDIKRIIAYSTCSQLGYMFFALGISAYGAAVFHLFTHAFFKALLFLGAGAVIHALSDEQDIRRMGGIRSLVPTTYAMMWIGSLALAGVPFFAGYYSKDAILEAAYCQGTFVGQFSFAIGLLVAILTAFYSWRLLLLVFHGTPRADDRVMARVHEAPQTMKIPLYVLAFGSLTSGFVGYQMFLSQKFWGQALASVTPEGRDVPYGVEMLPFMCALVGLTLAYGMYYKNEEVADRLAGRLRYAYLFSLNKGFIDELYDWIFVRPTLALGRWFWKWGDRRTIDRFGPDGITMLSLKMAGWVAHLQTGYVYHYAFAMLVGVVALALWVILIKGWPL